MLRFPLFRIVTFCACALCGMASPHALADEAPDFAASTISGDWGGARTVAWENGYQLEAGLKWDALHGRNKDRSATRNMVHTDLKLRTDLDKVLGWQDTVAYLNVIDDRGSGSNAHAGSLMGVSNIEVPVSTTRVFHAWVQKGFFDDRFSVLAGIYPIDSEFFALDSASMLLHPAYGTPADLALTNAPSVFNNAAFGLRAKWYSSDRTVYGMAALMDGVPNDPAHPKRTAVKFGNGTFAIAEFGWMPLEKHHTFDFEQTDPTDVRMSPAVAVHEKYGGTAKFAAGLWGYSRRQADLQDVDVAGDPQQRRSHGGYVLAERTLFGLPSDPLRNLTAFARYTFADPNTTAIDRSWNLGFKWRGPLASRPQDAIALGWTRGRLADKYRQQLSDPARAEEALELSWRVEVSPWLAIQPDVQRIFHPGGNAAASAVTIVGARFELVF
jgi:porin